MIISTCVGVRLPSFNPYFVGDESGRVWRNITKAKKRRFNPYFVGDESGRKSRV